MSPTQIPRAPDAPVTAEALSCLRAEILALRGESHTRHAELAVINAVQTALAGQLDIQSIYEAVGSAMSKAFGGTKNLRFRVLDRASGVVDWRFRAQIGRRLEQCAYRLLERQTPSTDIVRVISQSPTDVMPVADVIVNEARRFMGCHLSAFFRRDDEALRQLSCATWGVQHATSTSCPSIPSTISRHERFCRRRQSTESLKSDALPSDIEACKEPC